MRGGRCHQVNNQDKRRQLLDEPSVAHYSVNWPRDEHRDGLFSLLKSGTATGQTNPARDPHAVRYNRVTMEHALEAAVAGSNVPSDRARIQPASMNHYALMTVPEALPCWLVVVIKIGEEIRSVCRLISQVLALGTAGSADSLGKRAWAGISFPVISCQSPIRARTTERRWRAALLSYRDSTRAAPPCRF